jgi:hypothetical protein
VLGRGNSSTSSTIGAGTYCCCIELKRELVFAAMVADARSQGMLHCADETRTSRRNERARDFWMASMRHSHSESTSCR